MVASISDAAMGIMTCTDLLSKVCPEFSAAEQDEIYDAFKAVCDCIPPPLLFQIATSLNAKPTQYAQIHGQFVASVVDKHGIVAPSQGCKFIASCFLANKTCIGAFTPRVTALVPTRVEDAKSQHEALETGLNHAIDVFWPMG